MYNGSYSGNLGPVVLQDLLHGVLLPIEGGFANIERDLERTGGRAGPLGGVEEVGTGGQELRQTSGPNCTFTVNRQVVETTLCER